MLALLMGKLTMMKSCFQSGDKMPLFREPEKREKLGQNTYYLNATFIFDPVKIWLNDLQIDLGVLLEFLIGQSQ